ncbi:hypothetical protein BGZ68_010871 [Mortierella alpina]|nr:hypothetical protein BGZ68_010871 [Mortierella alpina]
MSGSTRSASRILTFVRHHIAAQSSQAVARFSRPACSTTLTRHRLFAPTRFLTTSSHHTQKQAGEPIEKQGGEPMETPATTIEPPKIALETPIFNTQESVKSIEQVIAELNQDARTAQSSSSSSSPSTAHGPESTEEKDGSSSQYADANTGSEQAGAPPPPPPAGPKRPSRFWFYLYYILFYSALGSLPVHVLLTKNEAKDTKERQEWKIAVLTDMRDKLQRGESIEEEEALLSVGMDRSTREEQVDDKYFEDLLQSAEKMDFLFNKDKDATTSETSATTSPAPAPSPPVAPRKPAPPKTEKSYL